MRAPAGWTRSVSLISQLPVNVRANPDTGPDVMIVISGRDPIRTFALKAYPLRATEKTPQARGQCSSCYSRRLFFDGGVVYVRLSFI
jgi:hypothetical protein